MRMGYKKQYFHIRNKVEQWSDQYLLNETNEWCPSTWDDHFIIKSIWRNNWFKGNWVYSPSSFFLNVFGKGKDFEKQIE
jgi:hypothetical protein